MDRRSFIKSGIKSGAAAVGAAVVGPTLLTDRADAAVITGRATASRPITDAAPGDCGIDTVVILMMENRSFDSYFGWLANDYKYMNTGLSRYGWKFRVDCEQSQQFLDAEGEYHKTRHFSINAAGIDPFRGCGHPDPGHGWNSGRAQRDQGFVADGSGNDDFALSYYNGEDLAFYRQLAYRFTVADHWHASILGPTYPNREYLLSAQSGGNKTNYLPIAEGGFQWPTIVDRLAAAGVGVADYASDLPPFLLFGGRMLPFLRTIDDYHTDCAAGTLPAVSFIDPAFNGGNRTDDHPHGDFRAGQRFVQEAFAAFARSSHWERGLFIVVYDEWGGFFDHVTPPHLPDDLRNPLDDANDFSQAGFRVPAIIASPRARKGFVTHRQHDHTSVARFLEWRFLGAPAEGPGNDTDTWFLTQRDRWATNVGKTLTLDLIETDIGFDLDLDVGEPSAPCAEDAAAAATGPAGATTRTATLESDTEHPFATPEALEYFDSLGFRL
jgi:phospholipase C